MNSTSTTLDDHRLQGAGQSMKRLMLAFHDHRADRVGVGEFNFHWIDVPQDSLQASPRCLADDRDTTPIRGHSFFLNASGQRINQSVEHGRNCHLGAIACTEFVHGIAHMGFHRFHGDAEQIPDGVVGEAAGHCGSHFYLAWCELLHKRRQRCCGSRRGNTHRPWRWSAGHRSDHHDRCRGLI